MTEWLLLLLPVAAASGWIAAKRSEGRLAPEKNGADPRSTYFRGLNLLLNEQPDKAIDVFIRLLEVDSDTVETHLALGNLFRRRGEVDRAIRIHQNLIARPTLGREQRAEALLELGQDYMRAGLFDRAESLFNELVEMSQFQQQALRNLKTIYQQEKDWDKCLAVSAQLEVRTGESLGTERAHYYCELAEQARARKDPAAALGYLRQAQTSDPECIRATMLQADMAASQGDLRSAMRDYERVASQDPACLAEVLPKLGDCYRRLGEREEWVEFLREALKETTAAPAATLALSDAIQEGEGPHAAAAFLTKQLCARPSLEGLARLISLHSLDDSRDPEIFAILRELVAHLLARRPTYQCQKCGFGARTLHWQCPGCRTWGSIRPVSEIHCDLR
jgi:lipopolysaccharide biosynthesis regulator YciM